VDRANLHHAVGTRNLSCHAILQKTLESVCAAECFMGPTPARCPIAWLPSLSVHPADRLPSTSRAAMAVRFTSAFQTLWRHCRSRAGRSPRKCQALSLIVPLPPEFDLHPQLNWNFRILPKAHITAESP